MHGENFLLAVSRIALTFVTFASIVNLMRHGRGLWTPNEIRGLKLIVKFDVAAAAFALLPFPVFYSLKSEDLVWRICGSALSIFLLYAAVSEIRIFRNPEPLNPDLPRHPKLFNWAFVLPMVLAILLEAISVARPSLGLYSWGLLWLLCPPAIQFLIYLSHFGERLQDHTPPTHDPAVNPEKSERKISVS